MPIQVFNNEAIQTLQTFAKQLKELQVDETAGRSDYSTAMVQHSIQIIDGIIDNNSLNFFHANKKLFLELMIHLDAGRHTFVPEVFNAESQKLAQLYLKFLQEFDFTKALTPQARAMLSTAFGDVSRFQTNMLQNLEANLKLYEVFISNGENVSRAYSVTGEIPVYSNWEIPPSLDGPEFEEFRRSYSTSVAAQIEIIKTLSYVKISNAAAFVNVGQPYTCTGDDVISAGNAGGVIWHLINQESQLNQKLLQKFPGIRVDQIVTDVYCYYRDTLSKDEIEQLESRLTALVEIFKAESVKYEKGAHLPGFGTFRMKPNALKLQIITDLCLSIDSCMEDKHAEERGEANYSLRAPGVRAFQIFRHFLTANHANSFHSKSEGIAVGHLSRLINVHSPAFMSLSLSGNASADLGILNSLRRYEKELRALKIELGSAEERFITESKAVLSARR